MERIRSNTSITRIHGYELMMAPYAIAHMKIGLKLFETGYRFGSEERARVYLTNALEPSQELPKQKDWVIKVPALAHEAEAVNNSSFGVQNRLNSVESSIHSYSKRRVMASS